MLTAVAMGAIAASAFAVDVSRVERSIPLKNGATRYIFGDGKMAMEDKAGRIVRMKGGEVMEAQDGQKIMTHGDEVMRREQLLHKDCRPEWPSLQDRWAAPSRTLVSAARPSKLATVSQGEGARMRPRSAASPTTGW